MAGDLSGRLPIAGSNDELDRLAGNLNVMLERIEALMHGLKEVSDNIAHDLKTPLTRLRNRAEEALRTAEDEVEYRAALERDDRGVRRADPHLQRAVDDRARGVRPGARRHDRTSTPPRSRAAIGELYEPLADDKGLTLRVEAADVGADARQPRAGQPGARQSGRQRHQICGAGQCHAGAGTPPLNGVQPEIVVKAAGDGDRILLTVADNGPGIPADDRVRAVERFVRLEQSRSLPGSGLGLSLATAVARLHGGELRLEDNAPGLAGGAGAAARVSAAPASPPEPVNGRRFRAQAARRLVGRHAALARDPRLTTHECVGHRAFTPVFDG